MKRKWKPGDVALVPFTRGDIRVMFTTDGWVISDAPEVKCIPGFSDIRPLVVIDPEDREQVERLHQSILRVYGQQKVTDAADNTMLMQAALREFDNPTPPKPEEPMGLGAVVATGADGDFIRVSCESYNPWLNVQTGVVHSWLRVAAVRVLSEGVAA